MVALTKDSTTTDTFPVPTHEGRRNDGKHVYERRSPIQATASYSGVSSLVREGIGLSVQCKQNSAFPLYSMVHSHSGHPPRKLLRRRAVLWGDSGMDKKLAGYF